MADPVKPPKIEHHPLIAALGVDASGIPERTARLVGYPGPSAADDTVRLWLGLDFSSYVDIPNSAIRFSKSLPEDWGTVIWVSADTVLNYTSVTSRSVQADFLNGAITSAHLALAAAVPGNESPLTPAAALSTVCSVPVSCCACTGLVKCNTRSCG